MNIKNKLIQFDVLKKSSFDFLIGTDEAGRGPGAGPVFAAAVCFVNIDDNIIKMLDKVNDSKQLSEKIREELFEIIIQNSVYSIKSGSVEDIEKYNILRTSLRTMSLACQEVINKIESSNIKVLVDGNKLIPQFKYPQEYLVKGDATSFSVAAASILAKVCRDRFMIKLDEEFPQYYWAKNKGYLTEEHLSAIDEYGLTRWHRKSFLQKHFDKSTQMSFDFSIK